MTKQELRKVYLQKRLTLSDAEYATLNIRLCENFFQYADLANIHVLHTFLPITKNREPDTWLIIRHLQQEFPHVKISIPRISSSGSMESFYFEDEDQLQLNSWGIPEPVKGIVTDPAAVELVLTPLLVFDKTGQRIGYGKGYYDRFFALCSENCVKVGLSFFEPVKSISDVNVHDIALDLCVTPEGWHEF